MNDRLRERLGISRPVVTFADLPRPLVVMAVDLRRGCAKIWSRATDPEMPVGLAVRCACSNPFLFAPVELEDQLLADGSLLGAWSFDQIDDRTLEDCSHLPALLFRLPMPEFQDLGQHIAGAGLMHRIGDIVISNPAGRPPHLTAPCQEIEIPAGGLMPDLAFSRPAITRLLRTGYNAVTSFLANEKARVAESGYVMRRLQTELQPNLVDQTMIEIRSARRNILIAGGDLSWAWELFPVFALKALEGISIRIVSTKSIDPVVSTMLGRLGCDVRRSVADLLTYGTFIDADEPDGTAILINIQDGRLLGGAVVGDRYVSGVLAALMERLELLWQRSIPQNTVTQPVFESLEWRSVEEALRAHVAQYRDSLFSVSAVEVKDLLPLTSCLNVAKLRRAEAVAELYQRCGEPLFVPMRVRAGGWLLAPPVVEVVDGRWAVIDGLHRIYHCRNRGITTIRAILVQHASEPPPATIGHSWDPVFPRPYDLGREQRYKQYEQSRWRDLRSAWMAIAYQSLPNRPSSQALRYPSMLPQS
jgi:hypothetical protein